MKIAFLLLLTPMFCFAQTLTKIEALIEAEISSEKVVSLAVAIIKSGEVVHISANGYRNLEKKDRTTIHTPYQIASVSKTVTSMAIFKLIELEKLALNDNVNDYLPFSIQNPFYPDDEITIQELLNHKSGIRDDEITYAPYWGESNGDPVISLDEFLKEYLLPAGSLYKDTNYESDASYQSMQYCNTGYAVLGLIVESVTHMKFDAFCNAEIFEPTKMENTSWFLRELDTTKVAKSYSLNKSNEFTFKGFNGYPDYPGGQLRTSISDFSKLIVGYLNSENGEFLLNSNTTNKITPPSNTSNEYGYTWFPMTWNGRRYFAHKGNDIGVTTGAMIDIDNNNGVIVFANSDFRNLFELTNNLEKLMWEEK